MCSRNRIDNDIYVDTQYRQRNKKCTDGVDYHNDLKKKSKRYKGVFCCCWIKQGHLCDLTYYFTSPNPQWCCFNDCMTYTRRLTLRLTGSVFRYSHGTYTTGRGEVDLIELGGIRCEARGAVTLTHMKGTKKKKGQPVDSQRWLIWFLPLLHHFAVGVSKVNLLPKLADSSTTLLRKLHFKLTSFLGL